MENGILKKNAEPQINIVIGSLLDLAADKNDTVRDAVNNALRKISKNHTNDILKTVCMYRQRNSKLTNEHVAALLQPLEEICLEHIIEIDGDTVLILIDFCVEEMIKSTEYIPNVQLSASALLVALGKKHCIQVMEGILKKFNIGTVPHYTVPHTMGALASINAFGVIPFLKSILGKMLPMLGMLKTDPMKQSFAFALGKFCEAINEYMSNIQHAPDPTITTEMYSNEISISYELFVTSWIHTREPRLTDTLLQSLGPMFSILTKEKITEHTPKLITTLLILFKKQKEILSVTQCLAVALSVICEFNKSLLDSQIDSILNTLSEITCSNLDFAQPETIKNQSEILRCFDTIGKYFCDKTVDHLIQMLRNNEREKIKALQIITHLVNSSDSVIKTRIPDLISVLKQTLNDSSMKVKIALLKTIVAFAYHGNFFNSDGDVFIVFIIRLCCTPNVVNSKGVQEIDSTEWFEMVRTCDNSLFLLTSTVLELENVLWRLFLECFLNREYIEACCTLMRCLTHLAGRKKEIMKLNAGDGNEMANAPSSEAVLARCLTLLSCPLNANRGTYILNFLRNFAPFVNKHLQGRWDEHIPLLVKFLEQNSDKWSNKLWEEQVLEFITVTIKDVDEIQWTESLTTKFMEQVPLYSENGEEKGFLFKCLATAACHIQDVNCVKQKIDTILGSARLNNMVEANACAKAIAICSRVHLSTVLFKLNVVRKEELLKKASKFLNFNFIKDNKQDIEIEKLRYTVIACYSELVLVAPAEKLLITIEHEILNWIVQELQNTKDFQIRHICLAAIGNIAEAMHPSRNPLHIRMSTRDDVLNIVLGNLQLHSGAEYIELFPTIIPVLTSLVRLRNELDSEMRINILKTSFDTIYNAASIYCKLNVNSNNDVSYGELKLAPNVFNSFDKLNELVQTLLLQSVSPATLDDILTMLEPWLGKRKPEQRLPAIENCKSILECYLTNMKFSYEAPSQFGQTGFILGRLVPRCTDPNTNIRLVALECVRLVLYIAARYEGHMSDYNNEIGTALGALKNDIETNDPKLLFTITSELAKIVSQYLPHFQLMHFTESLLDGLLDHEPSSSSGSSVTLQVFLKLKGGELYQHVSDIILKLLKYMNDMTCSKTRSSSVRSVLALAIHHPKAVTSVLLTHPLPYESCVSDCWMMLAHDNTLSADILEQFKRLFSTISLYDEQQNTENLRIVTLQPLAAVCALREMFRNIQMQDIVISQLPELFAVLLMIVSSYIGTSPPIYTPQQSGKKEKYSFIPNRDAYKINPAKMALETFKLLLLCAKCDKIAEVFLQHATLDTCTSLLPMIDLMPNLANSVFESVPHIVGRLVTSLNQYVQSNFEPQRVISIAFFVEVVKHRGNGQPILVETVITTLLNSQTDSCAMVRQLSLRGLSYVSGLDEEQRSRHCTFVFSALMQGLDDPEARCNQKPRSEFVVVTPDSCSSTYETNIPLEAMLGLSKMLHAIEERQLDAIQVSTAVRIKPFYEKEDSQLRSAAFRLFGDLAMSFGSNYHVEAFKEQVSGNFICLLLHLSDDDSDVVKACKYTLRQVTPFLEAPKVNTMIQTHLIEEGNLHYLEFINDLIKIMTEELSDLIPFFVMNALQFVKGHWSMIRGNAALMVGYLYCQLPGQKDVSETVQFDTVCYRLMQLLQDDDSKVRAKAVQGLSYLFVS